MSLPMGCLDADSVGKSIDLVVEILSLGAGCAQARDLWTGKACRVIEPLSTGVWTLYGYHVRVETEYILEPGSSSLKFRKPCGSQSGVPLLKEICAGLGGISAGARESGFHTAVFLDWNKLACEAIHRNAGCVIQADIATRQAKIALHSVRSDQACILTAGFPCQPFSRQGDCRGFSDARAGTFQHVALATWYLQPEGLVLECVTEAEQHIEVRAVLAELAAKMGWRKHDMFLDLAAQWPCRRQRWWCVLLPADTSFSFSAWPRVEHDPRVRDVIPEWPCWPAEDVEQLLWDEHERQHFLDPQYGSDVRQLDQHGIAPTTLHSCGSPLRSCPCGCRGPLSEQRLLAAGLRGFGVFDRSSGSLRHPHPQEIGLLNGLSLKHVHGQDLRAELCLIGQIASPLQACWVFAQVRDFLCARSRLDLPPAKPPHRGSGGSQDQTSAGT